MRVTSRLALGGLAILSLGAAQAQERPAITGIAFVRMYSADAAASKAFYGKTLGFHEVLDKQGVARYGVNRLQWLEVEALPAPPPETRLPEVAFATRNAAQMQKYLVQHKVALVSALHEGAFTVRDPEGNLIGFVQQGKGAEKLELSEEATSKRIIHAGFVVHDRGAEDAFYRDLLGFRLYWYGGQTDANTDYVAMQVPDGTDWVEYMLNGKADAGARQRGVMNHFSLGVRQMSDAVAGLERNGCSGPNCSKTQMGRDGKIQLNLYDPDLTRVEFMEFKPSGPVCCSEFKGRQPDEQESR